VDADITIVSNRLEQALAKLLTQFKGLPVMEGILASYVEQVQELENVFIDLLLLRTLDNATGAQLDGVGAIVGELRLGRNDTDYRAAIAGRIKINRQHSRIEDVITAMLLTLDEPYELTELSDAKFILRLVTAWVATFPSLETLNAVLQRAKGGGIKAFFQYATVDDDKIFRFASGDTPELDSNQGYANDAQTTGGTYSDVVG
jgi:hypothetical protein